jgi:hypothetical protein
VSTPLPAVVGLSFWRPGAAAYGAFRLLQSAAAQVASGMAQDR